MNTASTTHQDLSDVAALTDDQLVAELTAAQDRFAAVRVADPHRVTLAYSDAKLAVRVLTDETRRRAADVAAEVPGGPCSDTCRKALSTECRCVCAGVHHGEALRFAITTKPLPKRSPFAGIAPAVDDLFDDKVRYDATLRTWVA